MKIIKRKQVYKSGILLLFISWLPLLTTAQIKKERVINKTFTGKDIVKIDHRRGPIYVVKSNSNELRLEIKMSVEATSEADAKVVLENFNVDIEDVSNRLSVETKFDVTNFTSTNRGTKIKFKNGVVIKDAKNVKSMLTLYVPQLDQLHLNSKYDEINIDDGIKTDLVLNMHSGKLDAGTIDGNLEMDLKYSKGKIGDVKNADLKIYDCDLKFGSVQQAELSSKYSDIELKNCNQLTLDTYDDDYVIENIAGDLAITDKYSDIKLENFSNAKLDLYDTDIFMGDGKDMQIKSKYSDITLNTLTNLNFELSYDDNIKVENLDAFHVSDSKYSEFTLGTLKSQLTASSYDDNIRVNKFTGPLKGLSFTGKYSELFLRIPADISYNIEAKITYGELTFPKEKFNMNYQDENISNREVRGTMKDAASDCPTILLDIYDCKVDLK